MSDVEPIIEHELGRMLPVPAAVPDWADVERRFARRGRAERQRFLRLSRLALVIAVLALGITVAVVAPWSRSGASGIADQALAALGSQPVLHVVAQVPTGGELIDLTTGASKPVTQEMEIWYDRERGLEHTILRADGRIVDDSLETPEGGYTASGLIYDCAWIAAHPIEATKARVSCKANGNNGTTPRVIPRPKPAIDPGLQGFLDGYQQALAKGNARKTGTGELGGRSVVWLAFGLRDGGSEQVAVDSKTMRPLLVRTKPGAYSYRIRQIGTETAPAANFAKPRLAEVGPQPSFGGAVASDSLAPTPESLKAALPGAVWAGSSFRGLPLISAQRDKLRTTFSHHTLPPEDGIGLQLRYGANPHEPSLWLMESTRPQFGYMWGFVRMIPSASKLTGKLYASAGGTPIGFTVVGGIYTTIRAANDGLLLAAASELWS